MLARGARVVWGAWPMPGTVRHVIGSKVAIKWDDQTRVGIYDLTTAALALQPADLSKCWPAAVAVQP